MADSWGFPEFCRTFSTDEGAGPTILKGDNRTTIAGVDNICDVLTKSLAAPIIIAKLRPGLTGYEQLPPPPPRPRD